MIFRVYQDAKGTWRWSLFAANKLIVADSAEGYATRGNARRAVRRMRRDLSAVPIIEDKP